MFRTLEVHLNMHLFLPLSSRGRLGWGCSLFCDFILIDRITCLLETTAYLVEMLFARDVFLSACMKLRKDRAPFCFKTLHRGNKHSSFPCSCVGVHKGCVPDFSSTLEPTNPIRSTLSFDLAHRLCFALTASSQYKKRILKAP